MIDTRNVEVVAKEKQNMSYFTTFGRFSFFPRTNKHVIAS